MSERESLTSDAVTQFAVVDALLAGAYDSGIAASEVSARGDFGLGCVAGLGGEVVILDGEIWECTVDGPPDRLPGDDVLPFVEVCPWREGPAQRVADLDLPALTAAVEASLVSRNLFAAVRLKGVLRTATVRATPRQRHPFLPLADVTRHQVETGLREVAGTLVGFWSPAIYQGIAVAGLHLHFLADDRSVGGHVLDVEVAAGDLRVVSYPRFHLHLPTDDLFLRTELTHDDDHRIVAVEGGVRGS